VKVLLKGCRRCGGDLFSDREDREHRTLACLQCGLSVRLVPVSRPFDLRAIHENAGPPVAA
jgi:hypothetical protein